MNRTQRLFGMPGGAASAARLLMLAAGLSAAWSANAANCTDAPASGRSYYIVNKASGLQLDVAYGSTKIEADVIQWTGGQQKNQQWQFTQTSPGVFTIRAEHTLQALDLLRWDQSENAPVKQYTYSGNFNQQWVVARSGDAYTIASMSSNKLLTMPDKTAGSTLRQNADQQGSALQRWYFNPVDGKCSTSGTFGSFMGFDRVLVGGLIDSRKTLWGVNSKNITDTMSKAPWDLRYTYIHSSTTVPDTACYTLCNAKCFGWWGCEGMDSGGRWNLTAGGKILNRNKENATVFKHPDGTPHKLIEQWTYYAAEDLGKAQGLLNQQWGITKEFKADYRGALKNQSLLKAYLDDYRFLLKTIGNEKNIIHLEPDFWGFIRDDGGAHPNDANWIPAALSASGVEECKGLPDSAGGVARCMIRMAKKHAPNSTVGLHFTCWEMMKEPEEPNRGLQACIRYYKSLGAETGDFLAADVTDRDAGWASLPENGSKTWYHWSDEHFDKAMGKFKTLSEAIGKPLILWQIPLGNVNMPNKYGERDANGNRTAGQFKDDKVWHLFTKMDKVTAAHVVALQFGPGHNETTSTETDGGYLLWYARDYYNKIKIPGSQHGKLR